MSQSVALLLSVHAIATAAMAGLIWFVQVVHYPLFRSVGAEGFVAYEVAHSRLTSFVVGPFMAVEGVCGLILFFWPPDELGRIYGFVGCVLLAIVHASTIFVQVPKHGQLSKAYDPTVVDALVATNWIRTIVWSARAVLAGVMIVVASS
jgi:uncharacterized membrane protein